MPHYDYALLDAIEALGSATLEASVWRHMFNDYPPERPNRGGARWNPPGLAAVYTALLRETAIAEGDHAIAVQPRTPKAKRVLYEVRVSLTSVVDLTDQAALAAVGLTPSDVASDDFAKCQVVGGAVAWLGRDGLLIPSARHHGNNLVIFLDEAAVDFDFERVSTEVLHAGG